MGLTVGAWGASMPTLWSSVVVAKRGSGDMAISNALGANVFSVLVGLGLPWFAYPLFTNKLVYIYSTL
jgi:Ca2+/Na+ antiporter